MALNNRHADRDWGAIFTVAFWLILCSAGPAVLFLFGPGFAGPALKPVVIGIAGFITWATAKVAVEQVKDISRGRRIVVIRSLLLVCVLYSLIKLLFGRYGISTRASWGLVVQSPTDNYWIGLIGFALSLLLFCGTWIPVVGDHFKVSSEEPSEDD